MAKIQLIAIHADGVIDNKDLDRLPTLKELQDIVGGYLELIPHFHSFDKHYCRAFCNEEGKLRNLPENPLATGLWYRVAGLQPDVLVGSIAVVVGPPHILREM